MNAKTSTPPQAYTRETLQKAFEWMKSQPESVREKVTSADAMVRFYLHSKRFGSPTLALLDDRQPNLEDLISVENFKQDLKDLAQGLKQFEESSFENELPPATPKKTSAAVAEPRPSTKSVDSGRMQEQTPPPTQGAPRMNFSTQSVHHTVQQPAYQPAPQEQAPVMTFAWDEKTYMAIKATKERFNLSSDQEALRMLVATGFDRLRESFLKGF